jgi:SWI/SNF-related matrix-associated actin-dependent regulator 1 of chromatin subfamily A
MHPLLVQHHYTDGIMQRMAQDILKDPKHIDSDPELVFEDMTVMSDFELHKLCLENKVCWLSQVMM